MDKGKQDEIKAEFVDCHSDITHYLLVPLIEDPAISYQKNADLLYKLIHQVIDYITSYSGSELNTRKILYFHGEKLAQKICTQIKAHLREAPMTKRVKIDSGYAAVTSASYKISTTEGQDALDIHAFVRDKEKIRNLVFTGFNKCLFAKQKFDSNTE